MISRTTLTSGRAPTRGSNKKRDKDRCQPVVDSEKEKTRRRDYLASQKCTAKACCQVRFTQIGVIPADSEHSQKGKLEGCNRE